MNFLLNTMSLSIGFPITNKKLYTFENFFAVFVILTEILNFVFF